MRNMTKVFQKNKMKNQSFIWDELYSGRRWKVDLRLLSQSDKEKEMVISKREKLINLNNLIGRFKTK